MKFLLVAYGLCMVLSAQAEITSSAYVQSAKRNVNESAQAAFQRHRARLAQFGVRQINTDSPAALAKPLSQVNFQTVPRYQSVAMATQAFVKSRDHQFISDKKHSLVRRSSWLYPDDGCYARSALMIQNLKKWDYVAPSKLFIFGDLKVKTPNSPLGEVSWWYHVVPIVIVGQNVVVLDPAINPSQPMLLKDWVLKMTNNPDSVTFSVCHSTSYGPSGACIKESSASEPALNDQISYLDYEWDRLIKLRREPRKELGDSPPWLIRYFR